MRLSSEHGSLSVPKNAWSASAIASLWQACADGYSGKLGVVRSGQQVRRTNEVEAPAGRELNQPFVPLAERPTGDRSRRPGRGTSDRQAVARASSAGVAIGRLVQRSQLRDERRERLVECLGIRSLWFAGHRLRM